MAHDHAPKPDRAERADTAAPGLRGAAPVHALAEAGGMLNAGPAVAAQRKLATRLAGKAAPIQRKAAMKARVTQKGNLKKARKTLEAAQDQGGNRMATAQEIAVHDSAQHAGQHHAMRNVRLGQLIGDIDATLGNLTTQNLRDSDLLGAENKAGQGGGHAAIQLKGGPPHEEEKH
ncbi:MAG: hypothetical protein V4574_10235 [Pseudomonadota bacterium]